MRCLCRCAQAWLVVALLSAGAVACSQEPAAVGDDLIAEGDLATQADVGSAEEISTCPDSQTLCDGLCASLDRDRLNCGQCGNVCPLAHECIANKCRLVCPPGQAACQGLCYDSKSDPNHCGGCTTVCGENMVCENFQCICQPGFFLVGDQCVEQAGCSLVTPELLDFGAVAVGHAKQMHVAVGPCLAAKWPMTVTSISIMDGAEEFDVVVKYPNVEMPTHEQPATLQPGELLGLLVEFAPTKAGGDPSDPGTFSPSLGTILIETADVDNPLMVPLAGRALPSECPVAIITPVPDLHLFSSEGSYSANGEITEWEWSVTLPSVFEEPIPPRFTPELALSTSVVGEYEVSLDVRDSTGVQSCEPATFSFTRVPSTNVHIELTWKTPGDPFPYDTGPDAGSDLDLHFAHPWATQPDYDKDGEPDPWYDNLFDCFWFNPYPNWGSYVPEIDDNPSLASNDLDGFGPEIITLQVTEDVTYRVGVHNYSSKGYGASEARVRIFIYGELVADLEGAILDDKDLWYVATIKMPEGIVTPVEGFEGEQFRIIENYQNGYFFNP